MQIEVEIAAIKKRCKGQCEWVSEDPKTGEKIRCDEMDNEKAKSYKGTVHLERNFTSHKKK